MKFIVILLALVVLINAEYQVKGLNHLLVYINECKEELNISDEDIKKLTAYEMPSDDHMLEFMRCHIKKMGIYSDEKGFIAENVILQLTADLNEATAIITSKDCVENNEQQLYDLDYFARTYQCIFNKTKEYRELRKQADKEYLEKVKAAFWKSSLPTKE